MAQHYDTAHAVGGLQDGLPYRFYVTAMNAQGVTAAVLNRPGSLGPDPDKRSRGELPITATEDATAEAAAARIAGLDAGLWCTFRNSVEQPRDRERVVRNEPAN